MTRKQRKQKRKKQEIKPGKIDNDLIWEFARAMAKTIKFDRNLVNKKVFCKGCSQKYCLGFDGVEQFCRDCFYLNGCQKETIGGNTCRYCLEKK